MNSFCLSLNSTSIIEVVKEKFGFIKKAKIKIKIIIYNIVHKKVLLYVDNK